MFRRVYTWEGSQWGEEGASPSHILGAYQRGIIMSFFGAGRNISGLAMIYGGGVCFSTFVLGARYSLYFTSTYMFWGIPCLLTYG